MSHFDDFNNPQVAALPPHLRQYIVPQNYAHYTAIDQAVWRYVMRQNYSYLKDVAYYPYIPGLKAAGLSIERIPTLQEMNDALGKIGWGAVTVDGFIPPAAFMEYQAYRVLVIAADIRQLKHIEYTPAPDIIHESAGHAPIIAEPDYHRYLSYFGSIGAKAMYSAQDYELYEAIRELSILKEMPDADPDIISRAEKQVALSQQNMGEPSEMALLSRLHWWTVEYGLIGTLENPKIYGAGLLSSIGESASCMQPEVTKLPYTIDAVNYAYDITQPQKQLFVTPTFQNLIDVLETFADTMAFRRGSTEGLQKALDSRNTCTIVYSSGLQISGTLQSFLTDNAGAPVFVHFSGPVSLGMNNCQLTGHDKTYHANGYSSPVGQFELEGELSVGEVVALRYTSGIMVSGHIKHLLKVSGQLLLITFSNCTVSTADGSLLFVPAWGDYDLALGENIVSVFSGVADKMVFEDIVYVPGTNTFHPVYTESELRLQKLYQQVRDCREQKCSDAILTDVWQELQDCYPEDWLCSLEILEILIRRNRRSEMAKIIESCLADLARQPAYTKLIGDGLRLIRLKSFKRRTANET